MKELARKEEEGTGRLWEDKNRWPGGGNGTRSKKY